MKLFAPDYYPEFACIAGACRHSCCIGWEIDVDPDTREYYHTVPGEIGKRLAENIDDSGEASCFRLGADERCPFLNQDNLCDLILTLGEGALCQICDDHPRFRNFFSDRTEIGLGLCCEAAGKLILMRQDPVRLILLEDDGEDEIPDEEEAQLIALRDRLIAIAQDRSMTLDARIKRILAASGLQPTLSPEFLLTLERLDETWADKLSLCQNSPKPLSQNWEIPFENLLTYLIYRHLPGALEDGELSARIAATAVLCQLIRTIFAQLPIQDESTLIDLTRQFSSEIEYSDENLTSILTELKT